MTNALVPVSDLKTMAEAMCQSKLFGIKTTQEAMALMLIAQAEGSHPAIAIRDYHVIQGKPALKADAMLARFQAAGGKVEWIVLSDEKVSAKFSHQSGGSATIDWDMARAKKAQLGGNGMWAKYPRQMLRARVISEGVRTVFPGVIIGAYSVEEVSDPDFQTIEAESVEIKPDLSIHDPEGPTQAEKKAMFAEADEALDAVADLDDLQSWTDQYHSKLSKLIAKAHMTKLDEKAFRIQQTLLNKQNEAAI